MKIFEIFERFVKKLKQLKVRTSKLFHTLTLFNRMLRISLNNIKNDNKICRAPQFVLIKRGSACSCTAISD